MAANGQTVWRITTVRFAASAFSGEGARLYGGRWNPRGHELVYTAQSQSLALLELLVQDAALRASHVFIPAFLPADLAQTRLEADQLPANWRSIGERAALQDIGLTWLQEGKTAVLDVPSVVVPAERNFLLNPQHADFGRIRIGAAQAVETDLRLLHDFGRA